jgi:hypothetical protein
VQFKQRKSRFIPWHTPQFALSCDPITANLICSNRVARGPLERFATRWRLLNLPHFGDERRGELERRPHSQVRGSHVIPICVLDQRARGRGHRCGQKTHTQVNICVGAFVCIKNHLINSLERAHQNDFNAHAAHCDVQKGPEFQLATKLIGQRLLRKNSERGRGNLPSAAAIFAGFHLSSLCQRRRN